MSLRIKIYLALGVAFIVALLPAALMVWYVDPFQIYHRPFIPGMGLSDNQRYQNAGLVNSYLRDPSRGYDSVALGTSMSANISSEKIHAVFGWNKTIRLFTKAGGSREIKAVAEHAIATGKVKHLLWEINPWYQLEEHQLSLVHEDFPFYLYNNNVMDDLRYIFNIDSLRLSWKILCGDMSSNDLALENIGMTYFEDYKHQSFNENMKEALAPGANWPVHLEKWPEAKRNEAPDPILQQDVFPVLDGMCNRDIDVVLYIPPLSRLYYLENSDSIYRILYMPRHILHHVSACHNIRLYGFDAMSFTDDLNNYRDSMHYTLPVSDWLLGLMASGQHLLTVENIGAYEDQWLAQINAQHVHTTYPDNPVLIN